MNKKNYYEILQIDKNASQEVIEKVYKTLAKKYHPDLQAEADKPKAEAILKEINEAYDVLSNPVKRANYDQTLENSEISEESFNEINNENAALKNQLHHIQEELRNSNQTSKSNSSNAYNSYTKMKNLQNDDAVKKYYDELERARQKAYHDAYIQDLKNRGYKIRYKKSFKDYVKNIIALALTILVFVILWQIPAFRNLLFNIPGVQIIAQIIENIFS